MDYGKYIIVEVRGCELAIMFDSIIAHSDFLRSFNKERIISAGFFAVGAEPSENDKNDINVSCFGKSDTLKIESRKEDDRLLKRVLRKEFY